MFNIIKLCYFISLKRFFF